MDEQQTDGVGDRHNGTGIAGAAGWHPEAGSVTQGQSSVRAATDPTEPLAAGHRPPAYPAEDEQASRWHAPGLDDDTPPEGTPLLEPPLWREAARHAGTAPVPSERPAAGPPERPAAGYAVARHSVEARHAAPAPDAPARPDNGWRSREHPTVWEPGGGDPDPPVAIPAEPTPQDVGPPSPAAPAADIPAAGAPALSGLPQRVPAEPDVPHVPEPREAAAAAPPAAAVARIADQLRRDDVPSEEGRAEGFDVDAVLDAVRDVAGVRAAALRTNPHGAHTLRLDLTDDADPVRVSRMVAQLLQERMGLSASPQHIPHPRTPPESSTGGDAPVTRHATAPQRPPSRALRARPLMTAGTGPRVVIDQVQVHVTGTEASVEVRLTAAGRVALGLASGPAIDSYVVRLAAVSTAKAVDELMREAGRPAAVEDTPSRCFVEHTGVVPFGGSEVAVVVVLLVCGGWVEQLAGSAVVDGDSRHAAVRATLGAVNRRLDALLAD